LNKINNPDLLDLLRVINAKTYFKAKDYKIKNNKSLSITLKYYNGELVC